MDPESKVELLTHHPGGRHGDVEPSGIDVPSDRVLGLASEYPPIRFRGGGGFGCSSCKIITALSFLGQITIYRRRGGPRGPSKTRGGSWPRVQVGSRLGFAPGWPLQVPFGLGLSSDE